MELKIIIRQSWKLLICTFFLAAALLAGLEAPASGQLLWEGEPVVNLSAYRRNVAGIISQSYLLFPARTALENVCYPLTLAKKSKAEAAEEARELLNAVGIAPELYNRLP